MKFRPGPGSTWGLARLAVGPDRLAVGPDFGSFLAKSAGRVREMATKGKGKRDSKEPCQI